MARSVGTAPSGVQGQSPLVSGSGEQGGNAPLKVKTADKDNYHS